MYKCSNEPFVIRNAYKLQDSQEFSGLSKKKIGNADSQDGDLWDSWEL